MATSLSVKLWIEGSRFVAECPSLGVVGEGATREEALSRLRTAVSLYVDGPSPQLEVSGPLGDGPWCPSSVSWRQAVKRLKAAGFAPAAEHDGHLKLVKPGQGEARVVVVPPAARGGELAVGTLRAILLQAGMDRDEFDALMPAGEDALQ